MTLNSNHMVTATPTVPLSIGETTKRFNQQVNRNLSRFPEDFMFQLTEEEFAALRLQFATLKPGRGQHRSYLPYGNRELAGKVHSLERKVSVHERNIAELVDSMPQLLATPPAPARRSIGFVTQEELSSKPKTTKGKK
jgi:hypothetical protein